MSERLSLAVIDPIKERVHAFVTTSRKRLKGCHDIDVRLEASEAKGGYAQNGTAKESYEDAELSMGLRIHAYACTTVGDSFLIERGQLGQPLKPNTVRIDDDVIELFQQIIGVTGDKTPTLVWSPEKTVVAPAVAVARVQVENISEYMG